MNQVRSLVERFGDAELAELLRSEVVVALAGSCDDASLAYEACRYSDGFTYGTNRWRFGLGWVADTLVEAAAARVVTHGHLRLAVVGGGSGCLVYPLAVGTTAQLDLQSLRTRPSRLRQFLFGPAAPVHQLTLDFPDSDLPHRSTLVTEPAAGSLVVDVEGADDAELEDADLEDAGLGEADLAGLRPSGREVLLLAYTSNPTNGLLAAALGEARMAEDGSLTFLWCEQLPMHSDGARDGLRLVSGPAPTGPDFTTGAQPQLPVAVRTAEHATGGAPGGAG